MSLKFSQKIKNWEIVDVIEFELLMLAYISIFSSFFWGECVYILGWCCCVCYDGALVSRLEGLSCSSTLLSLIFLVKSLKLRQRLLSLCQTMFDRIHMVDCFAQEVQFSLIIVACVFSLKSQFSSYPLHVQFLHLV